MCKMGKEEKEGKEGKDVKWENIRNEIRDPAQFIKRVQAFDVTSMSEVLLKRVREKWFKMPEFNPKDVGNKSVPAGKPILI